MDSIQEYIRQKLGSDVPPRYSRTFVIQATNVGVTNVINANFANEKVALILCSNIWVSYNSFIAPVQVVDMYGVNSFVTPAAPPATDTQISGMFPFPYITDSAAISFVANNVAFQFSIFFQKVYMFNDNP